MTRGERKAQRRTGMGMPGFTGEQSIYRSTRWYRRTTWQTVGFTDSVGAVVAQAYVLQDIYISNGEIVVGVEDDESGQSREIHTGIFVD